MGLLVTVCNKELLRGDSSESILNALCGSSPAAPASWKAVHVPRAPGMPPDSALQGPLFRRRLRKRSSFHPQ